MKHKVSKELGLALDAAIEEFSVEGVLDIPKYFDSWDGECSLLNDLSTYRLAKYIIEGYEYSMTKEDSIKLFVNWIKNYNEHKPMPTKNSSYRRGRRQVLEEIEKKLIELNLNGGLN